MLSSTNSPIIWPMCDMKRAKRQSDWCKAQRVKLSVATTIVLKSFLLLRISSMQCSRQTKAILPENLLDFRVIKGKLKMKLHLLPKMFPISCLPTHLVVSCMRQVNYFKCMQILPVPLVEAHSVQDTIYIVDYSKVRDSPYST